MRKEAITALTPSTASTAPMVVLLSSLGMPNVLAYTAACAYVCRLVGWVGGFECESQREQSEAETVQQQGTAQCLMRHRTAKARQLLKHSRSSRP